MTWEFWRCQNKCKQTFVYRGHCGLTASIANLKRMLVTSIKHLNFFYKSDQRNFIYIKIRVTIERTASVICLKQLVWQWQINWMQMSEDSNEWCFFFEARLWPLKFTAGDDEPFKINFHRSLLRLSIVELRSMWTKATTHKEIHLWFVASHSSTIFKFWGNLKLFTFVWFELICLIYIIIWSPNIEGDIKPFPFGSDALFHFVVSSKMAPVYTFVLLEHSIAATSFLSSPFRHSIIQQEKVYIRSVVSEACFE